MKTANVGTTIGVTIKKLRIAKKMTQTDLREAANLSSGYVSKLEAGEFESPTIKQMLALSKALNMTLRDLLEEMRLISPESSLEGAYRAEGLSEEQIRQIKEQANFFKYQNALPTSRHS